MKIKGAAAYIDPLGFIGNQLESFTRQSCTFSDERSQSLTNQRIRWLQITNEFGITRGNYFRPLTNLKQTKKLVSIVLLLTAQIFCCRCCNFSYKTSEVYLFFYSFSLLRRLFDQSHKSSIASYWGRGARCNYRTAVAPAWLWTREGGHCYALL